MKRTLYIIMLASLLLEAGCFSPIEGMYDTPYYPGTTAHGDGPPYCPTMIHEDE